MRNIIVAEHTTLDGFVAGPDGEMDWIAFDDEMFDFVGTFTAEADTALYGRVTYQMMEGYWPTAADKPDASKHDKEHSQWYNAVEKLVLSRTMHGTKKSRTTFIGKNIPDEIRRIKALPGKNILMFGSPAAAHLLMEHNLIDEYWLFVNPVLLGRGIPLFADIKEKIHLKPFATKSFSCGVTALQCTVAR